MNGGQTRPSGLVPDHAQTRRRALARLLADVAAGWAVVVGGLALVTWALDGLALIGEPRLRSMPPLSALGFLLLGAGLGIRRDAGRQSAGRRFARGAGVAVALGGAVMLGEHLFGVNIGAGGLSAGPGPGTAFMMLGLALREFDENGTADFVVQTLTLVVVGASLVGGVGLLYGVDALWRHDVFAGTSVYAGFTFAATAVGLLCARSGRGVMALLTSSTNGGAAARRLLPVALVAPLVLGWLRLAGQRRGWYGTELGVALVSVSNSVVLTLVAWWSARSLYVVDLQRRLSEGQTRRSEWLTGQLFDQSPDAVLLVRPDGVIVRANLQASALFGYGADEWTGRGVETLIAPRFRSAHVHARAAYLEDPSIRPMGSSRELWALRRDGTEFPADITLGPINGDQGVDTLCVVRDITERRQREAVLELTQFAMDHGSDGSAWLRPDGGIAYVNSAMCLLTGYSREELQTLTVFDLNRQLTSAGWRVHWDELKRSGALVFERTLTRKDGRRIVVEVSTHFLARDGVEINCASYRDVTARTTAETGLRVAEERFRRAVAGGGVGLWDRDLTTGATFLSDEWKRQIGYEPDEVADDVREWQSRVHPDDAERVQGAVDAYLAGTMAEYRIEFRLRHKDGSYRHVFSLGSKVLGEDGRPVRLLGTHVDVTDRVQLQAQLLHAQRMEVVGRLAGGIAHDFNNLLTVISGTADLLLTALEADSPVSADVAQIRNAGDRAAALTRQLLAFSRTQVLQPDVLDLNAVVGGMQRMLQRLIGEDIELVVVLTARRPHVMADAGQIEQVIMNLIVNARDAMPSGGRLTITTADADLAAVPGEAASDLAGPGVELSVADTGVGMDAATRARVFDPFFTTKEQGKGTGLGLSTVYGIVTQSGGTVSVRTEPGAGTTFTIRLPRVAEPVAAPLLMPAVVPRVGSETVLIAEDEGGVRRLAARYLQSAGYTVLPAATGAEAIALVRAHEGPLHLLLTDMVMPGMSGRDLARQLVALRPGLKILYTSGYVADAAGLQSVTDLDAQFVAKPYTKDSLLGRIRDVLDAPALEA